MSIPFFAHEKFDYLFFRHRIDVVGETVELIKSKEKVEYRTCALVANDEVIAVLCLV